MAKRLTADEILPLVADMTPQEPVRLIRLIIHQPHNEGAVYDAAPPRHDEFSSDDEPLAWEAEGWEEFA